MFFIVANKVPMIDGVMAEEGVLMGYFLKENLNRLNVREIRYVFICYLYFDS